MDAEKKKPWWVFGGAILYIITFGKKLLTLLKVSKFAGPFISMMVSVGAYALVFPLEASIGLVLMIFIHELGHVWAAKRKGLPVSAPMFIPFLGALITMKRSPRDAATEAYVAIGGPLLGTLGATIAFVFGLLYSQPAFLVAAYLGFFINLFNLLPIHPLDGGRIATAVSRWLWLVGLVLGMLVIWYLQSLLLLIIWLYFAWNLGSKYVWKKKKQFVFPFTIERNVEELHQLGVMLPGTEHRRELNFTTFSTMDGQQKVIVYWEAMNIEETLRLPDQFELLRVQVEKITYEPEENPETMTLHGQIVSTQHENDRYYEVPIHQRLKFGFVYSGLAIFLILMLIEVQKLQYLFHI